MRLNNVAFILNSAPAIGNTLIDVSANVLTMAVQQWQETSMRNPNWVLAGMAVLAASLAAGPSSAMSTLDGWPSRTVYVSNDAPFVVFGVTPTQLDRRAGQAQQLQLSFIATDYLSMVKVFAFYRDAPGGRTYIRSQMDCGPREAGSWNCVVPVADLLAELAGPQGELGLRIEAHGDLQRLDEHSTVIVTVPVRAVSSRAAGKNKLPERGRDAPMF